MMLLYEDRPCALAVDIQRVRALYAQFMAERRSSGLTCPQGHHIGCTLQYRVYPFGMNKPKDIVQHERDNRLEHEKICPHRWNGKKWVDRHPAPPKPIDVPAWMLNPGQGDDERAMPSEEYLSGGCHGCPSYPHAQPSNPAHNHHQSHGQPVGSQARDHSNHAQQHYQPQHPPPQHQQHSHAHHHEANNQTPRVTTQQQSNNSSSTTRFTRGTVVSG